MASGLQSLNEVYSRASPVDASEAVHTSGQRQGLDRIRAAYQAVRPPECKSAAEAFNVLCVPIYLVGSLLRCLSC